MRKRVKFGAVLALLAVLANALGANGILAQGIAQQGADPAGGIQMTATIDGLAKGDKATLEISPEGDTSREAVIVSKTVSGDGRATAVTLSADLKDGFYQLTIEATDKYFRDPKGYFFKVLDSKVLNPRDRDIAFELIPPSARDYEPYRGSCTAPDPSTVAAPPKPLADGEEAAYWAESYISLSAPPREALPSVGGEQTRSSHRYYANYGMGYTTTGTYGALEPVDTGVRHDLDEESGEYEFAIGHVYSKRIVSSVPYWIEVGWTEASWQLDNRYLFTFSSNQDPNPDDWRILFSVTDDTPLYVYTQIYSGTTWKAWWWNGSYWIQVAYEDISVSTASNAFIGAEILAYDSVYPPSYPQSEFTGAEIRYNGSWDDWDTSYATMSVDAMPYHKHTTTSYTDFYVHKH